MEVLVGVGVLVGAGVLVDTGVFVGTNVFVGLGGNKFMGEELPFLLSLSSSSLPRLLTGVAVNVGVFVMVGEMVGVGSEILVAVGTGDGDGDGLGVDVIVGVGNGLGVAEGVTALSRSDKVCPEVSAACVGLGTIVILSLGDSIDSLVPVGTG